MLNEYRVDDLYIEIIGKPDSLPPRRYPQALAVALAMRHSWRREELMPIAKQLGIKLTAKALSDTTGDDTSPPTTT